MENTKLNPVEIAHNININNNHSAQESATYIEAAKNVNMLLNDNNINVTINKIIADIMEDNIINYNDIPKIIELYHTIKDYIQHDKNTHINFVTYCKIIELIILTLCAPLLGNVSQQLLLNIVKTCTKLLISTNDYIE